MKLTTASSCLLKKIMGKKYLIIQLGHFGDCLYTTTIAKQIKNDFPNSHITWAIAPRYSSILYLNPHVDNVWEIETKKEYQCDPDWDLFLADVNEKKKKGEFNEIIFSQILPFNLNKCTGTIRGSILNTYPGPITVSVKPVLYLSHQEIANVKNFAEKNKLRDYTQVVLFECVATSKQSIIDIDFALRVARHITKTNKDVLFIISSLTSLNTNNSQIIDASEVSFRENAELTKYCNLLIGCSSGITWVSTSEWAKKIPIIQFLKKNYLMYQGVKYDHELWKLDSENIVEMIDFDEKTAMDCIETALLNFELCARKYHQNFYVSYEHFSFIVNMQLEQNEFFKVFQMFEVFSKHNPHLKKERLIGILGYKIFLFTGIKTGRLAKRVVRFMGLNKK